MEGIQDKLRELRKKWGWSQEDLAREVGVSVSTVQRWEARGGKPYRLARKELRGFFGRRAWMGEQD